ncbi:Response regulator [Sulfidibacter corallicola]|uniref:Response regulator n=1 Tax=Sulfidibacter corallicola TaxID=2818388 RepID=A0A8A4TUK6_SULCO|nr:response regulator transcription factor [Sulfidibacter corallicola]QTD53163.1 response regulator [Sulfidibacter corallicola]
MKVILVDDEPAARGLLRDQLEAFEDIEIVAEAKNGVEAIVQINDHAPDLVFLDIQMPVLDGFDILPYLKERPMIVFCTAFDQYALKAFEEQALDYLLKPVEDDRLDKCLKRVRREWAKIENLGKVVANERGLEKIVCQQNQVHLVVWLKDVALFRKEGRYTLAMGLNGSEYLTDLTIAHLAEEIKDPNFFQINRSVIIRKQIVRSFRVLGSGAGELTTADFGSFSLSRSRVVDFRAWLQEK